MHDTAVVDEAGSPESCRAKLEELAHAAVNYPIEEVAESARVREEKGMRAGGFGILTARAMVDELIYNEAQNEVLFVKYLD